MSKSFYEFSKQEVKQEDLKQKKIENENIDNKSKNSKFNSNFNNDDSYKNLNNDAIEKAYNQFKNMDRNQLIATLCSEINKQKINGTFNPSKLENAIDNMGNYLTEEQKRNMKEMLNNFK